MFAGWPPPRRSTSPAGVLAAGCAASWDRGRTPAPRWPACWTDVRWPRRTNTGPPSLSCPSGTRASPGSGTGPDGQTAPGRREQIETLACRKIPPSSGITWTWSRALLTVSILVSCSAMSAEGNPRMLVDSNVEASGAGLVTPLWSAKGECSSVDVNPEETCLCLFICLAAGIIGGLTTLYCFRERQLFQQHQHKSSISL